MRNKIYAYLCISVLSAAIIFSNCANTRNHGISFKNTLSIFLLNNEKNYFLCIPVQYIGDYTITGFEFNEGSVQFGGFEMPLKRDAINIYVYLNKAADESGNSDGEFDLIYSEEKGNVLISKMDEPLPTKNESDYTMNLYDIYIEKYITDNEMKNIMHQYKEGNIHSRLSIWYDITIDNEKQTGNGITDDFELHNEFAQDVVWSLPHFRNFNNTYLKK